MNVLFICTSNKDRSPALEKYFREKCPQHEYRSAGVNKFHTTRKQTHYLTEDDLKWATLVVFAATIHKNIVERDFGGLQSNQMPVILDLGEYKPGEVSDIYLHKARLIVGPHLN